MAAQCVREDASGVVEHESQRRCLGAAARRGAEDAGAGADADDRQVALEKVLRQPQFGAELVSDCR